jgi:phospholipid/cholesterol/gamma-HCH transport system substrate-binding protein
MSIRLSRFSKAVVSFVVLALLVTLFITLRSGADKKWVTASFARTVSLYKGSDVRILGVTVGKVTSVEPAGTSVKVRFWYDAKYKIPADADADLVAPAIVGDRFIQLAPVYKSGAVLADNAVLGTDRTNVPLELDTIYQSIDDLMVGLGPKGANKGGALTHLLDVTASNFNGQGQQFHETIQNLSHLTETLSSNQDNLFGAASQIENFVKALAKNDQTVRDFNDSLASASGVLAGERGDLQASLQNLGVALKEVSSFVRDNRDALSKNIKGLNVLSKVLVKQRAALGEVLTDAPTALDNLFHTYNNHAGTLDVRGDLSDIINQAGANPVAALCALLSANDPNGQICKLLHGAVGRAPALHGAGLHGGRTHVVNQPIDPTLAGLEVHR